MFEKPEIKRTAFFWKIIPLAALIFGGIILFFVYLSVEGQEMSREVAGMLREGDADFQWYSQYLELSNPRIQMATNFAGHRMVIFSAVIRNEGERALDAVEVRVELFNQDLPVHELIRIPIRPEAASRTPPIPPFSDRGFTFFVEDLPSTWRANNAEMSIQGFRFLVN